MLCETVPLRVASCVIIEIVLVRNHKWVFKIFLILFLLRHKGKKSSDSFVERVHL